MGASVVRPSLLLLVAVVAALVSDLPARGHAAPVGVPPWKFAYTRNDGGLSTWASNRRRAVTVSGAPGRDSGLYDQLPVWSPDGSYVAFDRVAKASGIYVARVGREPPRRRLKTFPDSSTSSIAWSPDGRRLAASITCTPGDCAWGSTALYLFDRDGSQVRELVALPRDASGEPQIGGLAWSPDGRGIAYVLNGSSSCCSSALYTVDDDSGTAHLLANATRPANQLAAPTWSPDGRLIAYGDCTLPRLGPSAYCGIVVTSSSGGEPRVLFASPGVDTGLWPSVWTPDSQTLLHSAYTDAGKRLFAIDVGTGRRRIVLRTFADVISVARNGRTFAFVPEAASPRPAVATLTGRILDRGPRIPFFTRPGFAGSASLWIR